MKNLRSKLKENVNRVLNKKLDDSSLGMFLVSILGPTMILSVSVLGTLISANPQARVMSAEERIEQTHFNESVRLERAIQDGSATLYDLDKNGLLDKITLPYNGKTRMYLADTEFNVPSFSTNYERERSYAIPQEIEYSANRFGFDEHSYGLEYKSKRAHNADNTTTPTLTAEDTQ